jgi:hypothetical protein
MSQKANASLEDFLEYLSWRQEEKGLFERQFISEIRYFLVENQIHAQSEAAFIASFAALAGGWQTNVADELVNDLGVTSIEEARHTDLSPLKDEAKYHEHRNANAFKVAGAVNSLENLSINGTEVDSFSDFFGRLYSLRHDESMAPQEETRREIAFDTAMDSLEWIHTFRRLQAFDWLEVVIRAHSVSWLTPPRLKIRYINSTKPKEGFNSIFPVDTSDPEASTYLRLLESHGRAEQNMDDVDAVFDIESCLCTYMSDLDDCNWP